MSGKLQEKRDRQLNQSDYLQCNNYYSSFVMRSKPVARRFAQGRIEEFLVLLYVTLSSCLLCGNYRRQQKLKGCFNITQK